jgi:hypothetical protein
VRSHGDVTPVAGAAQAETDEASVLPSRVAVAIRRSQGALERAEEHVDEGEYSKAIVSLRSVRGNMYRADRAATHQLNAPPPTDEDAEAPTTGPDSVIAVLGLEHSIVTTTAGPSTPTARASSTVSRMRCTGRSTPATGCSMR